MNFLAHIFLSGDDQEIMVGNFIGDFVKGRNLDHFTPTIARGISLHRAIDAYTDKHPRVIDSKHRLQPTYHHYASVIVDVFYDHFLAVNFERFSAIPLRQFAQDAYAILNSHYESLPPRVQAMLPHMVSGNWLVNYGHEAGIDQSLKGMARRTTFKSGMEHAVKDLRIHYAAFEAEFLDFFPDIRQYVKEFLSDQLPLDH